MKSSFNLLVLCLSLQGCYSSTESRDTLTSTVSKDKLKEDFYLLQRIVQTAHAGAYVYNTPPQVSFLFDSVCNTINGPLTTREFYNKVDYVLDRLGCIHTKTILPDEYHDTLNNRSMFFPVPLIVIDKKIYVNTKSFNIPLGSEVLAVNNVYADELIKKLSVYTHTDGHSDKVRNSAVDDDFAINFYMAFGAFEKFTLKYIDAETGKIELVNVAAEKLKTINSNAYNDTWYFFSGDASYDFEIMDESNTAVLTVRTFGFDTYATSTAFSHFLDNSFRLIRQNNIRNLIIDIRNNGGGLYSNTYPLLAYLLDKPVYEYDSSIRRFDHLPYAEYVAAEDTASLKNEDTTRKQFTQIRPGIYAENKDQVTLWQPNNYVFKGHLYVITNPFVVSAAATFAAVLKDRTNAYIVGEETAGNAMAHNACVFAYELPNSHLRVNIPTRRFYQPVKARQNDGGIMPDKYMPFTLQDVLDNNDRPLTYILDSLISRK